MSDFKGYTDEQLRDELRSRYLQREAAPIEAWCNDCANFKMSHVPGPINCTKGHAMTFNMPEFIGDEYGFYRRSCADRMERESAS